MPIFGKESQFRKRLRLAGSDKKFVDTIVSRRTVEGKSVRAYERAKSKIGRYTHEATPRAEIEKEFRLLFPSSGKDFVERRFEESGRPVVVLDWGCGRGVAIREFADKYGEKIRPYGYGKDSYAAWGHKGKVPFIQATAEDLLRYLKKIGPVDLIYSHIGLMYLFPIEGTPERKMPQVIKQGVNYIERLIDFVAPGGKITFNITLLNNEKIVRKLKEQLRGKAQVTRDRFQVYLTKT